MKPYNIKQVYKTGILIVTLIVISISCEKDELLRMPEEEGLMVEQAVHFVELQKVNQFTLKSGGQQMQSINIKVDWGKAKCSSNENVWVVETQIKGEGRFGFATSENMKAWKSTGNRAFISSMSRLVVTKEKKSGEMHSFIMSIAGEKQYIEKKNFRLWDNTYLKRDKELSGYVFFHTLSGQFVNGWIYCEGKITNTVIDAGNPGLNLRLKTAAPIYEWVEYCTDYYTIGWVDGEVVSFQYTGSSCSVVLEYAGSYSSGGYTEDLGGGGYLPLSNETTCDCDICPVCGGCIQGITLKRLPLPGSGETSPALGDCPVCHCQDKLLKIMNQNQLDVAQTSLLVTALENLISEHCLAQALYNSLVESRFKINFNMDLGLENPASYSPVNKTMYFRSDDDINGENIKEELFHAMQDAFYSNGIAQYSTNGKVNIEFEAKLFKDIAKDPDYTCCYLFGDDSIPFTIKVSYDTWIRKLRINPSAISNGDYFFWLQKFSQYYSVYSSPMIEPLNTPTLLNSIIRSSDCY